MAILKAEINVPLVFTPKYADYAEGKFGAQVRFKMENGDLVYLPLDFTNTLRDAGLLTENGKDKNGNPAFRLSRQAAISYTRRERQSPLVLLDGKPLNGSGPKHEPQAEAKAPEPDHGWSDIALTYQKCATIAKRVWGPDYDPQALVAAAATLFIRSGQVGLWAKPKAHEPDPESFEDEPPALAAVKDDGLPF